jgi:preprotein translocase subunit SecB
MQQSRFEAPGNMEDKTFEDFCMISGTATLIPLLRAAIISFTSQAGLNPPIRIPLINVPQSLSKTALSEKREKNSE